MNLQYKKMRLYYIKSSYNYKKSVFMFSIDLFSARLYTEPEKLCQVMPKNTVMLTLMQCGLKKCNVIHASTGKLIYSAAMPSLALVTYPLAMDFATGQDRRNWSILCRTEHIKFEEEENMFLLNHVGNDLTFPGVRHLTEQENISMEQNFQQISEYLSRGTPNALFAAEMTFRHLLGALTITGVSNTHLTGEQQAAQQFKKLIDRDTSFTQSLSDLAKKSNYSFGHIRKLFEKYYQISPMQYRSKLRIARIEELIIHSNCTPKEIADAVGMNHVTHLYAFLKRHNHLPPGGKNRSGKPQKN